MKISVRHLALGAASLAGLLIGYAIIFCFYVAGLFGNGAPMSARLWERALRGTVLLGPFLGVFLVLSILAWRGRWATGVLPWATGGTAVLVLARKDAGILSALDAIWVVFFLVVAARAGHHKEDEDA